MNPQLKLLFAANSMITLAGTMIIPTYALFIEEAGGGIEMAGVLFGVTFLSASVAEIAVIRFKDKPGLSLKLLKLNFLIRGLAWLALAFVSTIPVIFVAQVIIGASAAFGSPAFNSLVSEHLDGQKHIREWGMWELVYNPSVALGSILGGFFVASFGFGSLFIIMSALAFISGVLLLNYKPSQRN